jgi:release factor glutamine methyltransferase
MSSFPAIVSRLRAAGCVFAEDEAELLMSSARTAADLDAMVDRRAAGLPLEHVLGWAEFCGLRIAVDPGVFVPRRRSEFLVEQAASVAPRRSGAVVVDLCCGSGALGIALVSRLGRGAELGCGAEPARAAELGREAELAVATELYACDIDPAAVRCARRNLAAFDGQAYEGDLFEPLPIALRGRVDVLLSNVPYVPTEEVALLPPEARDHEAQVALDGGADGLDVLRRVTATAPQWLAPGGHLVFETSERQASEAAESVARAGLLARVATSEELYATIVIGTKP